MVVLRTFSKIYGLAGLSRRLRGRLRGRSARDGKGARPFDLTTSAQAAAIASIGGVAEIARRRAVNADGLARLRSILAEHGLEPVPSVGNFLYVDTGTDANALFERLLLEGMIVRPLAGFGSPTAIRISVGTPEELDLFAAALGRVLPGA